MNNKVNEDKMANKKLINYSYLFSSGISLRIGYTNEK